jgi:hypothetical protein
MRNLLLWVTGLVLLIMLGAMLTTGHFAAGWEGGGGNRSLGLRFLDSAPLIYIAYCFACAAINSGRVFLGVSGIAAHAMLLAYFAGLVWYSHTRADSGGILGILPSILMMLPFSLMWFLFYRSRSTE